MTENELLTLIEEAAGRCQICSSSIGNKYYIDHDHVTNEVRHLLCSNCNAGLGNFKDSPVLLARAIEYLRKYMTQTTMKELLETEND